MIFLYFFPSTIKSSLSSLSHICVSPYHNPAHIHLLPLTCHMPCPMRFCHLSNICSKVLIMKLLIMYLSLVSRYFIPLSPKYSPCTLLSHNLSPRFSCNTTHDVSSPHKAQHKPHFTALHVIQIAFCELHSQQSFTVQRHGEQVHV